LSFPQPRMGPPESTRNPSSLRSARSIACESIANGHPTRWYKRSGLSAFRGRFTRIQHSLDSISTPGHGSVAAYDSILLSRHACRFQCFLRCHDQPAHQGGGAIIPSSNPSGGQSVIVLIRTHSTTIISLAHRAHAPVALALSHWWKPPLSGTSCPCSELCSAATQAWRCPRNRARPPKMRETPELCLLHRPFNGSCTHLGLRAWFRERATIHNSSFELGSCPLFELAMCLYVDMNVTLLAMLTRRILG
jgi:hypothetical protein